MPNFALQHVGDLMHEDVSEKPGMQNAVVALDPAEIYRDM